MKRLVPYPLIATKIVFAFAPFGLCWKPHFRNRSKIMRESCKREGDTIWWFRWLFLQISYSRWV